jgi:HAD superfamily hydrolase (TIGR01662 family)
MPRNIKAIVFDMGNTLMHVISGYTGPMMYWPRVEPVDGVAMALKKLPKTLIYCVASNSSISNSDMLGAALARASLREFFQYVFTSRDLGFEKPDPRFFYKVLEHLNVKPNECIMVGDEYSKDIVGAKSIDMHTIWFSREQVSKPTPQADAIIGSMAELPPAVAKLMAIANDQSGH